METSTRGAAPKRLREEARREVLLILGMVVLIAAPIIATLSRVRVTVPDANPFHDPTPGGYTVSLLIFIVPALAIGVWHILHPRNAYDHKAFLYSAGAMALIGTALDIAFGYTFFSFPNTGATMGIRIPAWSFCAPPDCGWGWVGDYLPVEEFGFYIFGAIYMAAVYLWADANWLSAYDPDNYESAAREHPRLVEPSPHALILWGVLLAGGIVYKRTIGGGGFPGYFVFLMFLGFLPSFLLYRSVKHFVNWRAMAFAFVNLVLVSIVWEATLGVPYGWWIYKEEAMLGIFIEAWARLPMEAVLLWLVGAWDAIMAYEFFRILLRMDRGMKGALFGAGSGASAT